MRKTEKGVVLRSAKTKGHDLETILDSKPRRTGKPENPKPKEMKRIWNE
jgi:hypothetical protein